MDDSSARFFFNFSVSAVFYGKIIIRVEEKKNYRVFDYLFKRFFFEEINLINIFLFPLLWQNFIFYIFFTFEYLAIILCVN